MEDLAGAPLGDTELMMPSRHGQAARLARQGQPHPGLAATDLFADEEWNGAYIDILAEKPVAKTTPTRREVIRRIAVLGGFLARIGDGETGVKTLWLGAHPGFRRQGQAYAVNKRRVSCLYWNGIDE